MLSQEKILEYNNKHYPLWLELIAEHTDINYYDNIYVFAQQIINDGINTSNHKMAEKLGLNPQQYTTVKKMLGAYIIGIKPKICFDEECIIREPFRYQGV